MNQTTDDALKELLELCIKAINNIRNNENQIALDTTEKILTLSEKLKLSDSEKSKYKEELKEIKSKLQVIHNVSKTLEKSATDTINKTLFNGVTYSEEDIE